MSTGTFNCYACTTETPKAFGHEHHKIPQSAGGTDKDIVLLCSGCHAQIHAVSYAVLNPKRHKEVEELLLYFKDEGTRSRIAELSYTVAKEMTLKADGSKFIEGEEKTVAFTMEKQDYLKLLFAAKDRRMSVVNFVKGIVLQHLERNL
jgi:hypothetical protein